MDYGYTTSYDDYSSGPTCAPPGYCMKNKSEWYNNNYGEPCYNSCPIACNWENEMSCFGGHDSMGCPMGDTCMSMEGPMVGNDGNPCYNYCPMTCGVNDTVCPGGIDWNGC